MREGGGGEREEEERGREGGRREWGREGGEGGREWGRMIHKLIMDVLQRRKYFATINYSHLIRLSSSHSHSCCGHRCITCEKKGKYMENIYCTVTLWPGVGGAYEIRKARAAAGSIAHAMAGRPPLCHIDIGHVTPSFA